MTQASKQGPHLTSELVCVAKLGRPHGTSGELRVWPLVPGSESLMSQREVFVGESQDGEATQLYKVRRCRAGAKCLILSLDGVRWRDQAEALKDNFIFVRSADLPELAEDEYYLYELKGLSVYDGGGQYIGVVDDIIDTGAAETLLIKEDEGTSVMVPFVGEIVVDVDLEGRRLTLDPPAGLLDATRS